MPTPDTKSLFGDLLDAVRAGDSRAWGLLCERFRPRLVARARALLGPFACGVADPSCVAQEALVKAWSGCAEIRAASEGELLAWLHRVLRSVAADQVRALGRKKRDVSRRCPLPEDSGGEMALADSRPSPSEAFVRKEEEARVEEGLARLSPRDGLIVRLRITERLSWAEVASAAGTTAGAAERAFYRALGQLRT